MCGLKTRNNKDSICYEEVAQKKKLTGISESSIFSCYFHHDREDMCPALDMRLMTGQVVRFDYYDIQSELLSIDFELEWIDFGIGGFHNCHSRLRMLWIEHGCYWLDYDVVTVGALVAVSLVSMNLN